MIVRRVLQLLLSETYAKGDFYWFFSVQSGLEEDLYFPAPVNKSELSEWRRWSLSRMKKSSSRFQDIIKVCKHFFRIISIRKNKLHDRTTRGSIFIVGNVREGRFLLVFQCSKWFRSEFLKSQWSQNLQFLHFLRKKFVFKVSQRS